MEDRVPGLRIVKVNGRWEWTFKDCDSDLNSREDGRGSFVGCQGALWDFAATITKMYQDLLAEQV